MTQPLTEQLQALVKRWASEAAQAITSTECATIHTGIARAECADQLLDILIAQKAQPAQPALTADEVREAALSARDQEILSVLIDDVQAFGAGDEDDRKDDRFQADTVALLRRLKQIAQPARAVDPAQREADLREAYLAGWLRGENSVYEGEGVKPVSAPTSSDAEPAAAEYARSKAGGS